MLWANQVGWEQAPLPRTGGAPERAGKIVEESVASVKFIVCAASMALTTASSVASIVDVVVGSGCATAAGTRFE